MKVSIEPRKCIAAGQCVMKAPMVFDQQEEDGIVILLNDHPQAEDQAAARLAARVCPAEVIHIHEE
jgi:ferredoxin